MIGKFGPEPALAIAPLSRRRLVGTAALAALAVWSRPADAAVVVDAVPDVVDGVVLARAMRHAIRPDVIPPVPPVPVAPHPAPAVHATARARPQQRVVMLDPGHGGKDPGAIGLSGTYEKQVALAAAQELKRQLEAGGAYRVELTRHDDQFIPLEDRVAMAEARGAALFMSIHADALFDHDVRGASVYTIGETASDAQSAALARRENSADRFVAPSFRNAPPEVAKILASLARQETRASANRLQRDMVDSLEAQLPMLPNPARHAGFVVLRAGDIPSILVEMGFMSNRMDEAALRQPNHRAIVAAAMKRAIDSYFASPDHATHLTG